MNHFMLNTIVISFKSESFPFFVGTGVYFDIRISTKLCTNIGITSVLNKCLKLKLSSALAFLTL